MAERRPINIIAERIAERLEAVGLSERKASMLATGQPDALRFIRTRGTMPSAVRLMKLANVLKTSPDYLAGHTDVNDWPEERKIVEIASTIDDAAERQFQSGRVVPVLGTVAFGDGDTRVNKGDLADGFALYSFTKEVLAFAAAPLGTPVGKLGGFYPADTVMLPVFEPNVPVIFVHEQEAEPGDYALLFFGPAERSPMQAVFALRRMVDRGEGWVTVEHFNPPTKRRIDSAEIRATWKVLGLRDYVVPPIADRGPGRT